MMPACPDCGSTLGRNAHKCKCGWTSAGIKVPHIDCFNAPRCTRPAMISTDKYGLKGQFKNFCLQCEQEEHEKKAMAWCEVNGSDTVDKRIDFCRVQAKKWWRGLPASWGQVERVPGEDDELESHEAV